MSKELTQKECDMLSEMWWRQRNKPSKDKLWHPSEMSKTVPFHLTVGDMKMAIALGSAESERAVEHKSIHQNLGFFTLGKTCMNCGETRIEVSENGGHCDPCLRVLPLYVVSDATK